MNRFFVWIPLSICSFFFSFSAAAQCGCTDCRCTDSLALVALYDSTNGDGWTNKTNWKVVGQTIDTWYGVTLTNGQVTNLSLYSNQLSGTIPNFSLPNLQRLDLYVNQLSGNIPNFNLPNLQYLNLYSNQLSGTIPNFNLPKLQVLQLFSNQLSGTIPIFNLPNLQQIILYSNQLSGTIPNFNLPKLQVLQLFSNQLSGNIPNFNLPNLQNCLLFSNQLSGSLPNFNLPNLQVLQLFSNQFSGMIPNFNLPKLEILDLYQNKIDGCTSLTNLPSLKKDTLFYNRGLRTYSNKLTFDDILPNIGSAITATFIYAPQDSIFKDTTYQLTEGGNLTINLGIDDTVTTNVYKWYKNNVFMDSIVGNNKRVFNNLRLMDAGVWTCRVTNPNAPSLTLYSRKATVVVSRMCQAFTTRIESTTPAIVPIDTGYIDICLNGRVNFKAKSTYPQNGVGYTQNDTLSNYQWDFGNGMPVALGPEVDHIFKKSGGFYVTLMVTDTAGCKNSNTVRQRVRVASKPDFKIGTLPNNLCPNALFTLNSISNQIDSAYSVSVKSKIDSFPLGQSGGGSVFIPDDRTQEFSTSLIFFDFRAGQILTNANDLKKITVNMEHSWARDLEIKVICPNGQQAILHQYNLATRNTNRLYLGLPNRADNTGANINNAAFNPPGTGFDYAWTNAATATWRSFTTPTPNQTFITLASGDYKSEQPLSNLVGCPLNGEWKIVVKDQFPADNGYIFKWGIEFDKSVYPNLETFSANIVERKWLNNANIIQNMGDSIKVRTPDLDSFSLIYQVKNGFGCTYDTPVTLRILRNIAAASKDTSICWGSSLRLSSGKIVNTSGNYNDTLRNTRGCDSLITTFRLSIAPVAQTNAQTPVLCLGQTYTLPNGQAVSTATNYRDTLRNRNGCDSLIRVVTVTTSNNPMTTTLNSSICRGQSYTLPNGQIVTPSVNTTYPDTLKNRSGCDSLIRITRVNVSAPTILPTQNAAICRGQSYTLPSGLRVSPIISTAFGDTLRNRNGCDSLIRSVNITVSQPIERPLSISICSGQNHTLPRGRIVSLSGTYRDTLRSTVGCDSIVMTTLTVTPPAETPIAVTICSGQTHRLPSGKIVSIAGVYRDTFKNAQGCNAVIVTTLTVNSITTQRNKTIFEGQKDTLPKGRIVNTEGVYRDSFRTANGCDSVVVTTLTVKKVLIDEMCFEEMKKNIPDAFSPNDDGINEVFDPEQYFIPSGCPASLRAEQLIIVSRWGEVIYQANPYKAWDGRSSNYKNAVMPSAYYYVLVFKIDGQERLIRGVINCFSR